MRKLPESLSIVYEIRWVKDDALDVVSMSNIDHKEKEIRQTMLISDGSDNSGGAYAR